MKIKAIDAMFGVIEDPTFFFTSPEMIKNAKVASMMALVTWYVHFFLFLCEVYIDLYAHFHFFFQASSYRCCYITILPNF